MKLLRLRRKSLQKNYDVITASERKAEGVVMSILMNTGLYCAVLILIIRNMLIIAKR